MHSNVKRMKQEGDMGVYGIAVLRFFSSGISVILIFNDCAVLLYHLALRYAVFHPFGVTVFDKTRSFTLLLYCSFSLSCLKQVNIFEKNGRESKII